MEVSEKTRTVGYLFLFSSYTPSAFLHFLSQALHVYYTDAMLTIKKLTAQVCSLTLLYLRYAH